MKPGALILGAVVSVILLAVAGVLYMMANDSGEDDYRSSIAAVQQIQRLSSDWSIEISRVKSDPLADFDSLAAFIPRMERHKAELSATASRIPDLPDRLANAVNAYISAVDAKEERVERFKTGYAVVRNSERYLPLAASNVVRLAEEASEGGLARRVSGLVQEMDLYLASPNDAAQERLMGEIEALNAESVTYPPALSNTLTNLVSHAEVLLAKQAPTEELFADATSNKISGLTDELVNNLQFELGRSKAQLAFYDRGMLVVIALLALFWIGLALHQRRRGGTEAAPAAEAPAYVSPAAAAAPMHAAGNGSAEAVAPAPAARPAPQPAPAPVPLEPDLEEATVRGFVVKSAAGTLETVKVLPRARTATQCEFSRCLDMLSSPAIETITYGIAAMAERRYQEVHSRSQVMLLPPCLDDYVSEHNAVRAIDAFVGTLDLQALGFEHTEANRGAGQPAFDPALLLKLYLYGYQHRVRSSRRLEAETRRNLEVIWLCQGAKPSYKTIADFRKDNLAALRATNREFVLLCRELSLLGDSRVAIDGTFLKANASPGSIYTKARLEKELKKLDERIAAYHRQLDEADAEPEAGTDGGEDPELAAKIEALVEKQKHKKALQERLQESGESQVSEVDPDARMMKKHAKLVGGYNCQIAVDDKHKLIVVEDVVQDGNDFGQFEPMMTKACEVTGNSGLIGLADVGYYSGAKLKGCEDRGMDVYVPIPRQLGRKGKGDRFGSDAFRYDPQDDTYVCPAGQRLARSNETSIKHDRLYFVYRAAPKVCRSCALSSRCLEKANPKPRRRVERWEHEDWVDRHRKKMRTASPLMRGRSALVEHPFGTIKRWAGIDHFLMRGLDKCRGEFSLMALGYNFKRMVNELGVDAFREHCLQKQRTPAIGV